MKYMSCSYSRSQRNHKITDLLFVFQEEHWSNDFLLFPIFLCFIFVEMSRVGPNLGLVELRLDNNFVALSSKR